VWYVLKWKITAVFYVASVSGCVMSRWAAKLLDLLEEAPTERYRRHLLPNRRLVLLAVDVILSAQRLLSHAKESRFLVSYAENA
jgi:hypothetical protein